MIEVKTVKEPDGWRVAISDGLHLVVLDEIFDDEAEAVLSAASLL